MTNEQQKAKELAELLTAFTEGKQLQFMNDDGYWCDYQATIKDIVEEFLYLDNVHIRIKPETKRVEYNLDDDLVGKIVIEKNKSSIVKRMIISQDRISVLVSDYQNYTDKSWYHYNQLSELFTWADGTPCYKEVECE